MASFYFLAMNLSTPKIIVFDIDQTLIFGREANRFYTRYGRALEIAFAREMGLELERAQECLNAYRRAYDGRGELAFDTFDITSSCVYDAICSVNPAGTLPRMDATIATITHLKDRARLLAITDGPITQARRLFAETGIQIEWFAEVIGWERGKEKPKNGSSRIFEEVISRYNIKSEELVSVGDTRSVDIEPAERIGARSAHIGDLPGSISDISSLTFK